MVIIGVLLIGPLFGQLNGLLLLIACFLLMTLFETLAPISNKLLVYQTLLSVATAFYACIASGEQLQFCHCTEFHLG